MAASINGEDAPNSISAPHSSKYETTSWKPPQLANVSAVSWVSSVCVLILAPVKINLVHLGLSKAQNYRDLTNVLILYPLKTPENRRFFRQFLGGIK